MRSSYEYMNYLQVVQVFVRTPGGSIFKRRGHPEGRISETGALLPLRHGAGLIALEAEACIVPLKISGTNVIVPYGKIMPRKRDVVTVRFGTPIKFSRCGSIAEVTNRLQAVMKDL